MRFARNFVLAEKSWLRSSQPRKGAKLSRYLNRRDKSKNKLTMDTLKLSLLFSTIYIIMRYTAVLCIALFTRDKSILKNLDFKHDVIVIVFIFLLSFALFSFINLEVENENIFNLLLISLISVVPLVVIYVFGPMRYLIKSENYIFNEKFKHITKIYFKSPLNVITLKSKVANAYATGILPFSKTIILNTGLNDKLTDDEIISLLYHEMGHHKNNHMLKLFLVNVSWSLITITFFNYVLYPNRAEIAFFPLLVSVYYGLVVTGGILVIAGAFQKRFEYEADKFAVENNKGADLATALLLLYDNSTIPHDQWTLNYPSLNQRLARIRS